MHLRSGYRINILIQLVLTVIIVALLLLPTSILFLIKGNNGWKIFVISAFTIFFAGMLHAGTKAQRSEDPAFGPDICHLLINVPGMKYSQPQQPIVLCWLYFSATLFDTHGFVERFILGRKSNGQVVSSVNIP